MWKINRYTGDPRFKFCEAKCDLFQGYLGYVIIDNKLASLEATLVRNYNPQTDGVKV